MKNKKQLVAFGNYLLGKERAKSVVNETSKNKVTHADLENFKEICKSQKEVVS